MLESRTDLGHRAFADRIVAEACFFGNSSDGTITSLCRDGVQRSTRAGSGGHCDLSVSGCDHGTRVAGIAMGRVGTRRGVAHGSDLVSIQVFSRESRQEACRDRLAPCAQATTRDLTRAMEHVIGLNERPLAPLTIRAVNISIGGGAHRDACDSHPMKPMVDRRRALGLITVVSSGNDGRNDTVTSPSCISSAIAVGNTTKADAVNRSSNHSRQVVLMAPGTGSVAPVPVGRWGA